MKRREFITSSAIAATVLSCSPTTQRIMPVAQTQDSKLRLSLAAYSLRSKLPNFRASANAVSDFQMEDFIKLSANWPVDAVELTSYFLPQACPLKRINELKTLAHRNGLDISGGAIGNNFSFDPKSVELSRQMGYTTQWIKTYAEMGVAVIRVFAGKPQSGMDQNKAVSNIIKNMTTATKIASDYGVILAMENHDFTTDIDRYLDIVQAIDSPWFGVNADTGNIASTDDPYKQIERIAPLAVNIQLKVAIPVNGVKQEADIPRLISIIKDSGYKGYVVLEYEEDEDPMVAIPRYLDQINNLI